jgi:hypothetical protein
MTQRVKSMDASLGTLEGLLGVTFSETFHRFWKAYVPDKTPGFAVQKRKLGGAFGRRGPHPRFGWLIQVEESLPHSAREVTLAHEIVHLALDKEGYPVICSQKSLKGKEWGDVASYLHSVLVHPVVWLRLREWGFPVDDHILVKATGRLKDLQSMDPRRAAPKRKQFPNWQLWLLQYMLARLEWGEPEREQIYEMFAKHYLSVGRQGEKYVKRLNSLGYSEPRRLTPPIVAQAGQMLLQRLDLNDYFWLGSTDPAISTWVK